MITSTEFINKAKDIAGNYKTLYVMGGLGYPLTPNRKEQCIKQYAYNAKRASMIRAASTDTFAFDCVGLIKSIIWGWNGSTDPNLLGGGKYQCNGLSDINEDAMINKCSNVSTDFSNMTPGEVVWLPGHIGIYIGNGLAIECTPAWKNNVQITACNCSKSGYNRRDWKKHGFLPWVSYTATSAPAAVQAKPATTSTKKSNEEIAAEVWAGKWGSGADRKKRLTEAGYDYNAIKAIVNKTSPSKTATTVAKDDITKYLPTKGYIQYGDSSELINRISKFMYNTFPAYTKKAALGPIYGDNLLSAIKEFQRRTGLKVDGYIGPLTLSMLVHYGFKL